MAISNRVMLQIEAALGEQNAYYDNAPSSFSLTQDQINAAKSAAKAAGNLSYVEKIEHFLATGEWPKEEK